MTGYHTGIRKQLLALGYTPLPNLCKACLVKGWNTAKFAAREMTAAKVESWERRFPDWVSTGLRVENGLVAVDADVDDGPAIDAWWDEVGRITPEFQARAPIRYGGGSFKLMAFGRVDMSDLDLFGVFSGAKFIRPDGLESRIELFGPKPTRDGNCAKQVGAYGPHTLGPDGAVLVPYCWDEGRPALHETLPADLPLVTCKQLYEMAAAFERWAEAAGWAREAAPAQGDGDYVFDIDENSRFETDRGETLGYDELYHGLRCASSFIVGDTGGERSKCSVQDHAVLGCIAVKNFGTGAWHAPRSKAPVDMGAFTAALKDATAGYAAGPPSGFFAPNWRECTKGGRPVASFHNAKLAIAAAGLVCSEDVFHNKMLIGRGEAASPSEAVAGFVGEASDARVSLLRSFVSDRYGFDCLDKHLRDAVANLAHSRQFDPVVEMLAEAEANWDGIARLDAMAVEHFNCPDTALNRAVVRKTMVAAVARARSPGCKFDEILTMEAPEGFNKSSAWAVLAGEGNFSDERVLGLSSKELLEQSGGAWVIEIADLIGMRKAEVEAVKAFASRRADKARMAYGHFVVDRPRRFIVVATTNNFEGYLLSQTGNRRFWPVVVQRPIDLGHLKARRLQLWGEAAHRQAQGESIRLDPGLWAAAAAEQEARRAQHPWEAKLAALAPALTGAGAEHAADKGLSIVHRAGEEERVSTADLLEHALKLPSSLMRMEHTKMLADVMRHLGWKPGLMRIGRGASAVRGYSRATKKVS